MLNMISLRTFGLFAGSAVLLQRRSLFCVCPVDEDCIDECKYVRTDPRSNTLDIFPALTVANRCDNGVVEASVQAERF